MDPSASQAEIADFFGSIGRIKPDRRTGDPRIWMYKDKMSGRNKGECTVTYEDVEAAKSAIDWFNGKDFRGYTIKVSVAERRTATDRSQGTPRGRGGFGGGIEPPQRLGGSRGSAAVRNCFAYFDANGSGFLDYRELRHALRYLGIDTSLSGAIDLLRRYDDWPDGKLEFAEFARLVEDLRAYGYIDDGF